MSYMKNTITSPVTTGGIVITDATASVPWDTLVNDMMSTVTTTRPVFTSVSPPPKGTTLVARARLNKGTMQAYGTEHARDVVKSRLVKDLLEQLINSGVVKITSDISKSGAATFTATVVVNEAA